MVIGSVLNTGTQGLQASQQRLVKAAEDIASPVQLSQDGGASGSTSTADEVVSPTAVVEPILALKQEEVLFAANAKVIEAGSDTIGALLNTDA